MGEFRSVFPGNLMHVRGRMGLTLLVGKLPGHRHVPSWIVPRAHTHFWLYWLLDATTPVTSGWRDFSGIVKSELHKLVQRFEPGHSLHLDHSRAFDGLRLAFLLAQVTGMLAVFTDAADGSGEGSWLQMPGTVGSVFVVHGKAYRVAE